MNSLFLDLKTTSLDCFSAEIIEGYFLLQDENNNFVSDYHLKSRVDKWNDDAAKVHGISENDMLTYPSKQIALDRLGEFLSSCGLFECIVYANPNQMGAIYHYDVAVMQMQLMNHYHVDRLEDQPFKPQKITSVYTLAKDAIADGFVDPIKKANGRNDLTLSGIYSALFDDVFAAHNAKSDVDAMIKVYNEINYRIKNGIKGRKQLELS